MYLCQIDEIMMHQLYSECIPYTPHILILKLNSLGHEK